MPEQFSHAPTMIGDSCRHCGRAAQPILGEAGMKRAEVVHRAHQVHPGPQERFPPQQGPCSSGQRRQPGAESGVQALDVGRIQNAAPLGQRQQAPQCCRGSLSMTWLPRCLTCTKPKRSNARIVSPPETRRSLGMGGLKGSHQGPPGVGQWELFQVEFGRFPSWQLLLRWCILD